MCRRRWCEEWAGEGPGATRGWGHGRNGAWAERTANMPCMVVTLDVLSKLSGWLNADASCPAKGRAYEVGSTRAGRRESVGRCRCEERVGEGPEGDQAVRGTGRAHNKHVGHGGDAGCVEAQRLVKCTRALPSRNEDIQGRRHAGWEARASGPAEVQGAGRATVARATRGCGARAERA